jgi:indole-3-acetate monooxygenase
LLEVARALGVTFAERAAVVDEGDLFVADNFTALKANGLVSAGVPTELGGGGATHAELCEVIRELARHCSSTALAFSMHTHQVATAAWRWRHQKAPVEPLLRRVAAENIVLVSSGGSDWLHGTGKAERVEGGYRINARKDFCERLPGRRFADDRRCLPGPAGRSDRIAFCGTDERGGRMSMGMCVISSVE